MSMIGSAMTAWTSGLTTENNLRLCGPLFKTKELAHFKGVNIFWIRSNGFKGHIPMAMVTVDIGVFHVFHVNRIC